MTDSVLKESCLAPPRLRPSACFLGKPSLALTSGVDQHHHPTSYIVRHTSHVRGSREQRWLIWEPNSVDRALSGG